MYCLPQWHFFLFRDTHLNKVYIQKTGEEAPIELTVDAFIPLFGLSPKLGPIGAWGLPLNQSLLLE